MIMCKTCVVDSFMDGTFFRILRSIIEKLECTIAVEILIILSGRI